MKVCQPAIPLVRLPVENPREVQLPGAQSKDRVQPDRFPRMTSAILFLLFVVCGSITAGAQDFPRVQVFGGYSYTRFDSPSFGFANFSNLNGYNFAPAYNLIQGFGIKAELSGQYNSKLNLRDLAVGPQFLYQRGNKMLFAHFLIGQGRSFVHLANGEGDTERAIILGGGIDRDLTSRFAWRVFQVDYVHTAFFQEKQNNLRVSTGVVYRWGTIKQKPHKAPAQSP